MFDEVTLRRFLKVFDWCFFNDLSRRHMELSYDRA